MLRPTPAFEDLSLAEALKYLLWRPVLTTRMFWAVLTREETEYAEPRIDEDGGDYWHEPEPLPVLPEIPAEEVAAPEPTWNWQPWGRIIVLALAFILAIKGGYVLHHAALDPLLHEQRDANGAEFWFILAGSLVVGFEIFASRIWWARRFPRVVHGLRTQFGEDNVPQVILSGMMLLCVGMASFAVWGVWGTALLLFVAAVIWLAIVISYVSPKRIVTPIEDPPADEPYVVRSQVVAPEEIRKPHTPIQVRFWPWFEAHAARLMLIPLALLLSSVAYNVNVFREPGTDTILDVVFTTWGFITWVASILLWIVILGVDLRSLPRHLQDWDAVQARGLERLRAYRPSWTLFALIGITLLGAYFRLHDLESTPPEMTSDHIEKLLDAVRVSNGYYPVFFPNNGGREAFQMYFISFLANVFGLGFSFNTLKIATVIEGIVTLPALWWMARQVIGSATDEDRRLGNWVGLALAALVAVSSWHEMLSRLGLRIVLTPLATALVIGFLAKAMRYNRMRDYLALGFTLGVGVYFYQADRMLPLLVIAGIFLAVLGQIRSIKQIGWMAIDGLGFVALAVTPILIYWYLGRLLQESGSSQGDRLASFMPMFIMTWFCLLALAVRARRSDVLLQYGGGLLAVVVVTLALYIPMYHYSELHPGDFWNRTRGRMFGEEAFVRTNLQTGELEVYEPSTREQVDRFLDHKDVFVQNYRDSLRMYHWEGDAAWISNPHAHPALGPLAGGLMILGLVIGGMRLVRRYDPVLWLIPMSIIIMLLPSAMTLAYVIENPSFTRASGTIPGVFLLAALPLGLLCSKIAYLPLRERYAAPAGTVLSLVLLFGVSWSALGPDWDNFFTDYRLSYSTSWKPYHEISRPLHDFAHGEGSYGNAFMISYPHWLDHRILGTMAGDIRWNNGLVTYDDLPGMLVQNQGTAYQYDPSQPVFFMYNIEDAPTSLYMQSMFPSGTETLYEYTYETEGGEMQGSFYIFIAPPGSLEVPPQ
jgi:hypothetical protein